MPVVNLGKFTPKKRDPEDKIGRFIDELLLSTEFTSLVNPITMYKNTLPYIPKALEKFITQITRQRALDVAKTADKASPLTLDKLLSLQIRDTAQKPIMAAAGKRANPDVYKPLAQEFYKTVEPLINRYPLKQSKEAYSWALSNLKDDALGWFNLTDEPFKNVVLRQANQFGSVPESLLGTPMSYKAGKALSEADRFLPQMLAAMSALSRRKRGDEEDAMQR